MIRSNTHTRFCSSWLGFSDTASLPAATAFYQLCALLAAQPGSSLGNRKKTAADVCCACACPCQSWSCSSWQSCTRPAYKDSAHNDVESRGFMRAHVDMFRLAPLPVAERLRMPCLDSQEVPLRG